MSDTPTRYRTNWSGNITFHADTFAEPATVADVQEAVRGAQKLRTVGSRHCFNDIADTTGTHLSLARLNRPLTLDAARQQVKVEGGIRYDELGIYLHGEGFALGNLASLPYITIAGACVTATHGSGLSQKCLSTAVVGLEFVNASGELVALSRDADPDVFPGAVVALGALGPITSMTLAIEPDFDVRQFVYRDLPFAEATAGFIEIMGAAYSVSLFTDWRGDTIKQVWIKDRGEAFAAPPAFFGARPADADMHPLGVEASACTVQMGLAGPSYDRLPHFRVGAQAMSGDELQVEYFFPRAEAAAVFAAFRAAGDRLEPVMMISEARTIAADDLWLSPFYQRDTVAIHLTLKNDWPALQRILPPLEASFAHLSPRVHWGKLFTLDPAMVAAQYPRLADFRALVATHDPAGKFRNGYLDRTLFAA